MSGKATLVTGATGNTGARAAVPRLLERGHHVRAFVHRQDARSERLAQLGAEIIVGELLDLGAVSRALQGGDGDSRLPKVVAGVPFKDGTEVIDVPKHRAA